MLHVNQLIGFGSSALKIGDFFQAGYYVGNIIISTVTYGILLAPKSTGQSGSTLRYKTADTSTAGTTSFVDGLTNSNNMNNASHPAAQYCRGLTIGGYTDWYLPALDELTVIWNNRSSLPSTETNDAVRYWSSTSTIPLDARAFDFSNGNDNISLNKTTFYNVRAARKFLIS